MEQEHVYLRSVSPDKAFNLKREHETVIAQIHSLDDLKAAIENVSEGSLLFHLEGRNDFASWVSNAVGCKSLGKELERIDASTEDVSAAREQMLSTLDYTLKLLREL